VAAVALTMQLLPTEVVYAVQQGEAAALLQEQSGHYYFDTNKIPSYLIRGSLEGMLFLWDCLQKG